MHRFVDQLAAAAKAAAEAGDGPGPTAARLLRVVLDAAGTPSGAILTFEPARVRLVMAASRLDEMCREALIEVGAVPEVAVEVVTALRAGDPLLARPGTPLHRTLCAAEAPGTAALLVPLRAYGVPTGMVVLLAPASQLVDGLLTTLAAGIDLLGHLVPRTAATDGGSVLVDVGPVTTIATSAVGGRVQVIDEAIMLDGMALAGCQVLVELPDLGAARRLASANTPLYANLAVPRGAEMIAAIRREGGQQPALGYLASGGGGRAFMLGPVEVTTAPFDPDEVAAAAARLGTGRGAVLVVGCDSGAVLALRQTLARVQTSVRLAWDLPSAQEALSTGDVDVIVVDLNLPEYDGHRLVIDAVRSLSRPGVVIVPGMDLVADGFAVLFAHDYAPLHEAPPLDVMLEEAIAISG